jgi:hypothetical protein
VCIQNGKIGPEEDHLHDHHIQYILGENTELYFAIGGGIFCGDWVVFSFVNTVPRIAK